MPPVFLDAMKSGFSLYIIIRKIIFGEISGRKHSKTHSFQIHVIQGKHIDEIDYKGNRNTKT